MKLLKIENNLGYFYSGTDEFQTVDKITKENVLLLVHLTLEAEDVDFDEFSNDLQNQAHQIIYKSIYEKLASLRDRRQEFKDESERLYLQEYERYRTETLQTGD